MSRWDAGELVIRALATKALDRLVTWGEREEARDEAAERLRNAVQDLRSAARSVADQQHCDYRVVPGNCQIISAEIGFACDTIESAIKKLEE